MASTPTDSLTMADGTEQEKLYDLEFARGRESKYEYVEKFRPGGIAPSTSRLPRILFSSKTDTNHEKKWRYLEIHAASESSGDSSEQVIRNTLISQGVDGETARQHGIALPYETFYIESPNGRHLCSVIPFYGPIFPWGRYTDQTDGDRVHQLCHSVTRAISYLHEHGICHGNIRPYNLRLFFKEGVMDKYTPDTISNLLSDCAKWGADLERIDGQPTPHAPKRVYSGLDWWDFGTDEELMEMLSTDVAIRDTGSAYLATDERPLCLDAPEEYRPPEAVMGMKMGTKSDIWALAATITEVANGIGMFDVEPGNKVEALMTIEELLGPVPEKYREAARETVLKYKLEDWEKNGKAKRLPKPEIPEAESGAGPKPIHPQRRGDHQRFCGAWYLASEEVSCLGDLLREMLKWDPDERWDAKKVLGHEWFANRYTPRLKPNSNYIPLEKEKVKRGKGKKPGAPEKTIVEEKPEKTDAKELPCCAFSSPQKRTNGMVLQTPVRNLKYAALPLMLCCIGAFGIACLLGALDMGWAESPIGSADADGIELFMIIL
ncbi:hypothetical protein PG997_001985 [Apiospora hydei]|uniref:Protein kinase domain-containing protein n=1 Tax=Apiospora hydei TaxID=1337664 RepID=A0ABR1X874_9PEZI